VLVDPPAKAYCHHQPTIACWASQYIYKGCALPAGRLVARNKGEKALYSFQFVCEGWLLLFGGHAGFLLVGDRVCPGYNIVLEHASVNVDFPSFLVLRIREPRRPTWMACCWDSRSSSGPVGTNENRVRVWTSRHLYPMPMLDLAFNLKLASHDLWVDISLAHTRASQDLSNYIVLNRSIVCVWLTRSGFHLDQVTVFPYRL
jgi:hypothetical protein